MEVKFLGCRLLYVTAFTAYRIMVMSNFQFCFKKWQANKVRDPVNQFMIIKNECEAEKAILVKIPTTVVPYTIIDG